MVVLKPLLEGEHHKLCRRCGTLGLCSPTKERSNFYPRRATGDYRSECRRCCTEQTAAYTAANRARVYANHRAAQARRLADPGYRATRREAGRRWTAARKAADPDGWRVHRREIAKRYRAKLYADPVRHAALLEQQRIDHWLRREREGSPLDLPDLNAPRRSGANRGRHYPVGPFRAWMSRLAADEQAHGHDEDECRRILAARLGLSTRRIDYYRNQAVVVSEATVDHAVTREGATLFVDVYPPNGGWVVVWAAAWTQVVLRWA